MKKIELYDDHAKAVLAWLSNTIHDMEVDEEFINEEDPGLLDGLRKIVSDLEGE